MNELKRCPICGEKLETTGPEDWTPTFCDPDSGGLPYRAYCKCGYEFCNGSFDFEEFVTASNRRADGWTSDRLPKEGE